MNDSFVREAKARIRQLDQEIADRDLLVEERKMLQSVVVWYEENRGRQGQAVLFKTPPPQLSIVPKLNRLEIADKRFHPKPDSKTSRMLEFTIGMLDASPQGWLMFPEITHALPEELRPNGESWKEGVRTAIKRAGARYGIVYENGGLVRRIKNPQAAEA